MQQPMNHPSREVKSRAAATAEVQRLSPDRHARTPHERGTTLIELMLGAVLMLVLLGTILSVCHRHSRLRKYDESLSLAFAACRNTIEELRSVTFATLPTMHNQGFAVASMLGDPGGLRAMKGDADNLPGHIEIVEDMKSGTEILYRVTVSVVWDEEGERREVKLQTLMTDRKYS